MAIPVFRPTLRRRDFNSVLGCLVSDRIGGGPLNHELASELARFLGVAGGACLASFAQALQCALEALELGAGDAVVLSALAPADYLGALAARGLRALVAEVDPATGLILRSEVERHLASGPKALLLHYPLGCVPESEELFTLGLPVLEDISQALGATIAPGTFAPGSPVPGGDGLSPEQPAPRCGSLGAVSLLSLAPEGIITAGCGAAVFARERRGLKALREAVERQPRDALLPDMNAALALAQLREIEGFLRSRRAIAEIFSQAAARSRHGRLGLPAGGVPFSFPVLVRDGVKQVRQYAMKRNIETCSAFGDAVAAIGQGPVGAEEPAGGSAPADAEERAPAGPSGAAAQDSPAEASLPKTPPGAARELMARCILFPLYPTLLKRDVQLIAKVLASLP